MTGIKDVARQAGVSIATVSNVINKKKPVSPELQFRVQAAIEELQYEVNPVGRGLKSQSTGQIGVIVPSFHQVFFPAILQGISDAAQTSGHRVSVFETGGDIELEKRHVEFLKKSWIDGIILASYADNESISDREYIRSLARTRNGKKHVPVTMLETSPDPGLDTVGYDNDKAANLAMNHLLSLGHKKIAHITGPLQLKHCRLRLEGYKAAMRIHEGVSNSSLISQGDFSPMSGYRCMKELLAKGETFTAVFAANDQMAIGAMRALLDAGKRIPEDVAVIGMDNTFPSTLVCPSLSTVNLPKYEMGLHVMELLQKRIKDPKRGTETLILDTALVIRKSTSNQVKDDWDLENW